MNRETNRRMLLGAVVVIVTACSQNPQPQTTTAAVDSAALRARADSIAMAHAARMRADSIAAARARADSIAMAARRARPDSVRAQVQRDGAGTTMPTTASGLDAADEARLAEIVYFDYDRSDVRADQVARMEAKLAILRANARLEVQVEGHADDRGPDEYNLALGNRRAAAVKRWFVEHGIAESRLAVFSYGEERPLVRGEAEQSYAQNRRAEFRVTRPAR